MEAILHNCCGLDVHKDSVFACILKTFVDDNNKEIVEKEFKIFNTFPNSLRQLREWLESKNCSHVAMESTGVYWHPIYDALESAFDGNIEILVANARHLKNVPGRKTDMKDSEWIASLLRAGLLSGSFIPPENVRKLRQVARYRKTIVEDITRQKNRIEKTLQIAGFKLSSIISNIHGVSGRNLITILINKGQLNSSDVERVTKCISQIKKDEIKRSINGRLDTEQREFLRMQIAHLDTLLTHLESIEQSITDLSAQFKDAIERLDTIPGIATTSATAIIAETGVDMTKF
jgi:transposase